MASGTINGVIILRKIACKIEWESVGRSSDNTSVVKAFLYCKRANTSGTIEGTAKFTISIDGESKTTSDFLLLKDDEWRRVASAEKIVSHMYDGTKSIYISAYVSLDGTSISADCGKNVDLDTIPIASELFEILPSQLTVSAGTKFSPHWRYNSILSESFWHKLVFSLGKWNTTIEKIPPGTDSYTVFLPEDLAYQIPNNTARGTMTVTLYTYESENAQTHIGSPSSLNYTVELDLSDFEPYCGRKLNPVTSNAKFSTLYLQGISKVSATLSGKGTYGAYIKSLIMRVGDESYSFKPNNQPEEWVSDITLTSDILHEGGDVKVSCYAQDSRGRFSDYLDTTINVIPYGKPEILPAEDESTIICARCDKDGNLSNSGTYLKIKARRSYFTVTTEDGQQNFCEIRYRYRTESDTDFSEWITILDKSKIDTDTIGLDPIPGVVSATDTAYVVQVGVIDDVGESDAIQFNIPTNFVVLDIPQKQKGKRIGIFRYASGTSDEYNHIDIDGYIHGGGVDSLTLGTMLTASDGVELNLNDLVIPGCYYSPDENTSQHIIGVPSSVDFGFCLEVRQMPSNNIRQALYYGETTWYRHWNGKEWSEWVCPPMRVSGASGTNNKWNYQTWDNGLIELWGIIALNTVSDDTKSIYSDVTLPTAFIEYPTVVMSISGANSVPSGAIVLSEKYVLPTYSEPYIRLKMTRDEGGLSSANIVSVSVIIKGKYKETSTGG